MKYVIISIMFLLFAGCSPQVKLPNPSPPPTTQPLPMQVTLQGEIVCLPHKNQTGPQTTECAFGLKTDDGKYYGLRDPNNKIGFDTGVKNVRIKGTLNQAPESQYSIEGVIDVETAL